jgi:hypothetical protein
VDIGHCYLSPGFINLSGRQIRVNRPLQGLAPQCEAELPAVCCASRIKSQKSVCQAIFSPTNCHNRPDNRDFCVIDGAKSTSATGCQEQEASFGTFSPVIFFPYMIELPIMIQFYFLSILLNALAGFLLVFGSVNDTDKTDKDGDSSEHSGKHAIPAFLGNESFRLILGVLCMVMGLLKILSPARGDLPVIGDLFPAAAGLTAGFVMIFDFYRNRSVLGENQNVNAAWFLLKHKKTVGFAAIAAAAFHFLFPSVLLL